MAMTQELPETPLKRALMTLRTMLERERVGTLSTLSLHCPGWPFGSLTPFALTPTGAPFFVLSDLAEHTKNLKVDRRASFLLWDSDAGLDPQAGARVTLVGTVDRVNDVEKASEWMDRWEQRLPVGRSQLRTADFGVYELTVEHIRFVGGFAMVRWVSAAEWRALGT